MATLLSPGVNISEVDLTTIVPSVAASTGAFAGLFRWGPVDQRVLIDSEDRLVSRFAKPTNYNAETWFTAANFLSYTNSLYLVRAANTSGAVRSQTFLANTVSSTVSNNYFFVQSGNTSGITAGMYVTQTSNGNVIASGSDVTVTEVINSTAIILSKTTANSTSVTLYFGHPETSYSAVGVEEGTYVSNLVNQIVKNENDYSKRNENFENGVVWVAKYPGLIGNSLRVSVCDNADSFSSNVVLAGIGISGSMTVNVGSNSASIIFPNDTDGATATNVREALVVGDNILVGNASINTQYLKITEISTVSINSTASALTLNFQVPYRLHTAFTTTTLQRNWEYHNAFGTAPGTSDWQKANGNSSVSDELHVIVVDEDGLFTGTPGSILETFKGLSRATDSKTLSGTTNYYKEVINMNSAYVWWANDRTSAASNTAALLTDSTSTAPGNFNLMLGSDGRDEASVSLSTVAAGYDLFRSKEDVDISIVLQGRPIGGTTVSNDGYTVSNYLLANYLIDNLVDSSLQNGIISPARRDCVVVLSPDKSLTLNSYGQEALKTVAWRNAVHDSSYAIMDSGYKYQYDRYNDVYRWIPLNGDIGGLLARTDRTNDPWWSPAGLNRGSIKNLVKLAWNPRQADRDTLYSNGVNPVVTFPGQGTVLFGDKTLQSKPSAFDRINVRRLFIILEKSIATAAKYSLFQFNDSFTRSQFKNLVTPYLRTVQGRRGVTDFLVVCDETNNTPQVIDSNQFVGDIYIKPARSINYIQLNFVAVGTGVQFSQIVGNF